MLAIAAAVVIRKQGNRGSGLVEQRDCGLDSVGMQQIVGVKEDGVPTRGFGEAGVSGDTRTTVEPVGPDLDPVVFGSEGGQHLGGVVRGAVVD